MADWGTHQPGRLTARYETLTGGPDVRRTYYLVRKHLGFCVAEWDSLPWWQQRMYAEELTAELGGGPDEMASNDDLSALGFNVT